MGTQGSPLPVELKKCIVVVKSYFDGCRKNVEEGKSSSVKRTANALNVGVATVKRVMASYNRNPNLLEKQTGERGRPPRVISDSIQAIVRSYIRKANQEGRHITVKMLREYLEEATSEQKIYERTLGRTLDRWGFTFGKGRRSQHLKEKDHVIAARHQYLREKRANRNGRDVRRPEVYLDESYVNKNHSNDFTWYSGEDGPWVQKPTGKGERLIIINAITKNGWVPGAKLTFKSTKKTGDYHGQMNLELFSKWFQNQLLPNIPQKSLIIMDNASYHNCMASYSAPSSSCSKEKITQWLKKNRIPVRDDCLKAELVEMLLRLAPEPTYLIDEIARSQGHEVLRTPPYHPELQPIEICWGIVKNEVARNCDFTMANLVRQLDKAFEKVTAATCEGLILKIRQIEDRFWEEDMALEKPE